MYPIQPVDAQFGFQKVQIFWARGRYVVLSGAI